MFNKRSFVGFVYLALSGIAATEAAPIAFVGPFLLPLKVK